MSSQIERFYNRAKLARVRPQFLLSYAAQRQSVITGSAEYPHLGFVSADQLFAYFRHRYDVSKIHSKGNVPILEDQLFAGNLYEILASDSLAAEVLNNPFFRSKFVNSIYQDSLVLLDPLNTKRLIDNIKPGMKRLDPNSPSERFIGFHTPDGILISVEGSLPKVAAVCEFTCTGETRLDGYIEKKLFLFEGMKKDPQVGYLFKDAKLIFVLPKPDKKSLDKYSLSNPNAPFYVHLTPFNRSRLNHFKEYLIRSNNLISQPA
jgi:hypothetical protein